MCGSGVMKLQKFRLIVSIGLLMPMLSQAAEALPSMQAPVAAPNVMALEGKYPDLDAALKLIRNNQPELTAYLKDPNSVCTVFIPTGQALQDSVKRVGKYAGKLGQNKTLAQSTLAYHIIPGQALTADQIGKDTTRALTLANETIYMWRERGEPMVYWRPDLPVPLNRTNIRAGKCIAHSLDISLIPPTANSMVEAWLRELGTTPALRPKGQWAPQQQPLPGSLEAGGGTPAPSSSRPPAVSGSGSRRLGGVLGVWPAGVMTALAVAAAAAFY